MVGHFAKGIMVTPKNAHRLSKKEVNEMANFIAIDTVTEDTIAILKLASERIYASIAKDKNIGIVALSNTLADELKQHYNFVYGILGSYVAANDELIGAKGKGGGIMLKSKYDALQLKQQEVKAEKTFSKFTVSVREIGFKDKYQFNAARRELGEHPTLNALKDWLIKKAV